MTAKIVAWDQLVQTAFTKAEGKQQFEVSQVATTTPSQGEGKRPLTKVSGSTTELSDGHSAKSSATPLPINRIYPHVFDKDIRAGQALIHLQSAISDAKQALEAFGEPDLQEVSTRLTHISVAMGKAHLLTDFNESLGGVVSYIRRATLVASSEEMSRSALNSLVQVLSSLAADPMMNLDEAVDLVDRLAHDGWHGEHKVANELIVALIGESEVVAEELQTLLFESLGGSEGKEKS